MPVAGAWRSLRRPTPPDDTHPHAPTPTASSSPPSTLHFPPASFPPPARPNPPPPPATPTIPTKPAHGDGGAPAVDAMAEHMKAQMAMSVPGPIHKKIAKYAGEWDESTTMEITGQPAQTTKGTVSIKSELGGR